MQCLESRYFSLCLTIVIYVSDGFSERMLRILCVLCCFVVFSVAVLCCAGHIISHNESPFFNKPDLVLLVACSASVASARVKVHLEYRLHSHPRFAIGCRSLQTDWLLHTPGNSLRHGEKTSWRQSARMLHRRNVKLGEKAESDVDVS